jgi:ribosome biogenesis GTPase
MPKGKGKQRKRVRKRSWDEADVDAVTLERRRVRGRESGIAAPVEASPEDFESLFSDIEPNGIVLSPYGKLAFVESGGEERLCRVNEQLLTGKSSILAPGDRVQVEADGDDYVVQAVANRKSRLGRLAVGRVGEQVVAANVETLAVVASTAQPAFRPGLVDRYLIAAELGGVTPVLCVNKMDLVDSEPPEVGLYREMGLVVFNTSCITGMGVEALRDSLRGRLSVLAGHSGVGKSSLINAMDPGLSLETRPVSDSTHKGRHATSAAKLHHLEGDIHIIDTPGVRQLGLWGISPEEVDYYFADLAGFATQCRFRDCTHTHEPDCAVRAAVEGGALPRVRYDSYIRVRESL